MNAGGLDWYAAMLELYPADALITPTAVLPPTITPSRTPRPTATASPTATPRDTLTPSLDAHRQQDAHSFASQQHPAAIAHPTHSDSHISRLRRRERKSHASRAQAVRGSSPGVRGVSQDARRASWPTLTWCCRAHAFLLFACAAGPGLGNSHTGRCGTRARSQRMLSALATPTPGPFQIELPARGAPPVSDWRPPCIRLPWAIAPYDHFYFARPIAADEINWPLASYRYGGVFFENVVHTGVDIDAPVRHPYPGGGPRDRRVGRLGTIPRDTGSH